MTLGKRSVRVRPLGFAPTIWRIGMLAALTGAAVAQPPSHGPAKGYLLITGGATQPPDYQRFIEMAGGKNARIVVIPTASVTRPTDQDTLETQYCSGPKSPFAAIPCTVIHTTDRTVANSTGFVAPLTTATGVWIEVAVTGGSPTPISTPAPSRSCSKSSTAEAPSAEAPQARPFRAPTWCEARPTPTTTPS
jgi:hypothetical protein